MFDFVCEKQLYNTDNLIMNLSEILFSIRFITIYFNVTAIKISSKLEFL